MGLENEFCILTLKALIMETSKCDGKMGYDMCRLENGFCILFLERYANNPFMETCNAMEMLIIFLRLLTVSTKNEHRHPASLFVLESHANATGDHCECPDMWHPLESRQQSHSRPIKPSTLLRG